MPTYLPFLLALTLTTTACGAAPAGAPKPARGPAIARAQPVAIAGDWAMRITIGERVFLDEVAIRREGAGYAGTLTVVGAWSAPLERVVLDGDRLSFEILAPEGEKPFRVRYEGAVAGDRYVGKATLPADGAPLGDFEATRQRASVTRIAQSSTARVVLPSGKAGPATP